MAKHDRRKRSSQPRSSRTVSIQVPLPVLGVLNGVREAFHGLCIKTGMQVLEAMMEGDREDLCGPKGRHQAERPAWRGGSVASQVTLGGHQVAVPRLRVRRADGEAPLPSFQWAAATDPLDEHTALGGRRRGVDAAVCGHVGPGAGRGGGAGNVEQRGVSAVRGAVSQAPAVVSQPAVGELDLRVVCIDGKVFRDHCMVVALGIDTQGCKHVLGLREGATETAAVASGLLSDLVTRGLPTDPMLLFVIDGAPGLRRAINRCLRFPRGGATLPSAQAPQRARPSARTAARFGRQGVAGCLGPRVSGPRGAGAEAIGGFTGARPPRRVGVHPGGPSRRR